MKINPQIEGEINNCVQTLRKGSFIIFPDETGWSVGCDAMNIDLIKKIQVDDNFIAPSLLLDEPGRLNKFVKEIPDPLWDLVEFSTRPMDIILKGVVNLPSLLLNPEGETVFRVVKDPFVQIMVHKFGKPVYSAQFADQVKPPHNTVTILNTPAYVVNLRIGAKITPDALVVIRLSPGGRIEFVRK